MFIASVFALLLLAGCSSSNDQSPAPGCSREADEASRVQTAQSLLAINASNYESLIDYWADDIVYREPVLTNNGRQEMLEYFTAVFSGTDYGFPSDRAVVLKDELYRTDADGHMTYMATVQWSGTFGQEFFEQTGMSIIKFRPGEGCPYYHRDYFTEGDTWWNIPAFKTDVDILRNGYIAFFGLAARCFDEDRDGYTKYGNAVGCARPGLDCNDFVPGINPGAMEVPGNGIDEDCNVLTPIDTPDAELRAYQ